MSLRAPAGRPSSLGRMRARCAARMRDDAWTMGPRPIGGSPLDAARDSAGLRSPHGSCTVHRGVSGVRTPEDAERDAWRARPRRTRRENATSRLFRLFYSI